METRVIADQIICSGALFYAKSTRRTLLLQKTDGKHSGTWGLVGGTNNPTETPWQGLQREITEEIGLLPNIKKVLPLEKFTSNDTVFNFHTYFCIVEEEFIPILSNEHSAWGWFSMRQMPKPVHRGLDLSLRNKIIQTKIQTIIDLIDSL
jgi:8-oxo-dGTP pyrophosphatase MutT (NUDIX family)